MEEGGDTGQKVLSRKGSQAKRGLALNQGPLLSLYESVLERV